MTPPAATSSPPRDFGWLPTAAVLCTATALAVTTSLLPLLQGRPPCLARTLLSDAAFTTGALVFLACGLRYGRQRHPGGAAAYRGAWLDAAGAQHLPWGFAPHYLGFAGVTSFLLPGAAMLLCAARGCGGLALRLLGGYQATFAVQMALETRLFHRNFMSPTIPFTFAHYRFWQLARGLWALHLQRTAGAAGTGGGQPPVWLAPLLVVLLAFWLFDYGVTAVQLPWVFNWQLQPGAAEKEARHEPAKKGD